MAISTKTLNFNASSSFSAYMYPNSTPVFDNLGNVKYYKVIWPSITVDDTASDVVSLSDLPAGVYVNDISETKEGSGWVRTVTYKIFVNSEWITCSVEDLKQRITSGYRGDVKMSAYAVYTFTGSAERSTNPPNPYTAYQSYSCSSTITFSYYPTIQARRVYYGFNGDYQLCEFRYGKDGEWTCPEVYFGTINQWKKCDEH